MLQDDFVQALNAHVKFVQVCPEVGIGLGVPRDPIRLVADLSGPRLVQPSTGSELTAPMQRFAGEFFDQIGPVDGFILKSRSPSCGIKDVKLHLGVDSPMTVGKASGVFAEAVMKRFSSAAIEDEGRLTSAKLRHNFLVRLFAHARLRELPRESLSALVSFHTEHKLQLMAYSPDGLRELGQIVANADAAPVAEVFSRYAQKFSQVTARPLNRPANVNVLQHSFGYVSKDLTPEERQHFLRIVEDYLAARVPLSVCLTLLQSWVVRFQEPYLARQTFFEPYPRALLTLTDSAGAAPEKRK